MNFTNYEEMAAMILFGIGFTTLLLHKNMIKKIIGFSMMDSAIYLFLAVKGYIAGRKAPIVVDGITSMEAYINPIPDASPVATLPAITCRSGYFSLIIFRQFSTFWE